MYYPPLVRHLTRDYAAVRCRVENRPLRYILDPDPDDPVFVVQAGEEVVEIPSEVKIVTKEGCEICPEGRFFKTSRTINPYHAILDIWDFSVLR